MMVSIGSDPMIAHTYGQIRSKTSNVEKHALPALEKVLSVLATYCENKYRRQLLAEEQTEDEVCMYVCRHGI